MQKNFYHLQQSQVKSSLLRSNNILGTTVKKNVRKKEKNKQKRKRKKRGWKSPI